jgi:endonuclease YncB( thermonuclease family)
MTEVIDQAQKLLQQCALMLLGAVLCLPALATEVFTARAGSVPDGDTLWVQPDSGGPPRKLRLQGIDAPEICQSSGVASRDALRQRVQARPLQVVVKYQDDYGRGLARISVDGQDLGALMVSSGHAWSSRWRLSLGPYASQESAARAAGLGLFSLANPELPRDFRQRQGSCYQADERGGFKLK